MIHTEKLKRNGAEAAPRYGYAGRRNLGPSLREDDPVRHERLAAIGKNGTQIRLHKKG